LYRYDPRLKIEGKNPFQLDSKPPKIRLEDYIYNETRYRVLTQTNPEAAARLLVEAQEVVEERWQRYQQMANA
jgi:pyruvate-ferredoxin/flavodoxin oxidoreductase